MTPDVPNERAEGIVVTVQSLELAEPVDLRLPGGVPVGRLLPRLVEALRLPEGTYQLRRHGKPIPERQSLFAARVLMGDTLSLQPVLETNEGALGDGGLGLLDRAQETGAVRLADLLPSQIGRQPARRGTAIALWSGPAGGTGRTTLAMALAAQAAVEETVGLLALSEPAVSAYLGLPRTPNVEVFFEGRGMQAAEQAVQWTAAGRPAEIRIVLGPTRPQEGTRDTDRIDALVTAARAVYDRLVIDLPPLVPGGTPWATTPLGCVDEVVLAVPPSAAGVAAAVTALSAMERAGDGAVVHLAVVRRAPGGLSLREMRAGVAGVWGACPNTVEVPFWEELPAQMDRGELPGRWQGTKGGLPRGGQRWTKAVEALAKRLAAGGE